MNMVAEGYYASKCIFNINKKIEAEIPIATQFIKYYGKSQDAKVRVLRELKKYWCKPPAPKGEERID